MSQPEHERRSLPLPGPIRRALTRWLVGSAPLFVKRRLHAWVRRDATWSAYYDELRRVEQAASGRLLAPRQLELVEALLFDELRREAPRSRAVPLLALAASTGALLLFIGLSHRGVDAPRLDDATWTARGARQAAPAIGLRVRCLDRAGARVVSFAEAGPAAPEGSLACNDDGLLLFSFTNLSPAPLHAFVVGVAGPGQLRWYAPFERDATSVRLEPGTADLLLDTLADLAPMPSDERVTLFALFDERPLSGEQLRRELERAARKDLVHRGLERLPVAAAHQARIDLARRAP